MPICCGRSNWLHARYWGLNPRCLFQASLHSSLTKLGAIIGATMVKFEKRLRNKWEFSGPFQNTTCQFALFFAELRRMRLETFVSWDSARWTPQVCVAQWTLIWEYSCSYFKRLWQVRTHNSRSFTAIKLWPQWSNPHCDLRTSFEALTVNRSQMFTLHTTQIQPCWQGFAIRTSKLFLLLLVSLSSCHLAEQPKNTLASKQQVSWFGYDKNRNAKSWWWETFGLSRTKDQKSWCNPSLLCWNNVEYLDDISDCIVYMSQGDWDTYGLYTEGLTCVECDSCIGYLTWVVAICILSTKSQPQLIWWKAENCIICFAAVGHHYQQVPNNSFWFALRTKWRWRCYFII